MNVNDSNTKCDPVSAAQAKSIADLELDLESFRSACQLNLNTAKRRGAERDAAIQRAEVLREGEHKIACALHPHKPKEGGWTYVPEQFPDMITALIQRAESAETNLAAVQAALPAERALFIAEHYLLKTGQDYVALRAYAAAAMKEPS